MSFDLFRKHVNNLEKEAEAKKKGKSGRLWELEEFRLGVNEEALARFFPLPEGEGPYLRKYHWPPGGGPKTCTAETADFGGKCAYCYYDQAHKAEQQKLAEQASAQNKEYTKVQSRLNQKSMTVMNVLDFRFYHIVPGEGDTRSVYVCNVEGPEGDPARCEHCASEDVQAQARLFGGSRRWEMKPDHVGQLLSAHQQLQKVCVHPLEDGTTCGQKAYPVGLQCPACGVDVVETEKVRRMSTKDLEAALNREVICPSCSFKSAPAQVSACQSGDHEAVRGTIFDKVLRVQCSGKKKEMWDGTEYEDKDFIFDGSGFDFEPVEATLDSWGFDAPQIAEHTKPQNLAWRYRPEFVNPKDFKDDKPGYVNAVLQQQSDNLKKANPWGSAPAGGFKGGGGGARSFSRRT